jgi:hypothetical protein
MTEPTQRRTARDARTRADLAPTVVQQRNVPEAIRCLSTLDSPDYVDHFIATASGATDKTPVQWAGAAVEGVYPWARLIVWRVLCGLRLEPRPSPDYLAGWRIADRGDSWIRIEASSWFMTVHIVFHVDEEHVSFSTFVCYDKAMAALVWPAVSIIHRRAVPDLLRYAVKRNHTDRSR